MGGFVVCDISTDAKASPHHAAIEKAQEELRLEYDVREERLRELEFLEKGGNPLDFKVAAVTSLSLQSTSLTDQPAEENAISEAKGSFALAASPYGDSVESSGKPGSSLGREPHTGDNLSLLYGDNSNAGEYKTAKTGLKGSALSPSEQSLQVDGQQNPKEIDDSTVLRAGVKGQAYARRNRSKSRSITAPSRVVSDPNDSGVLTKELQAKEHVIKSDPCTKSNSANIDIATRSAVVDDQTYVQTIAELNCDRSNTMVKDEVATQCDNTLGSHVMVKLCDSETIFEASPQNDINNHICNGGDDTYSKGFLSNVPHGESVSAREYLNTEICSDNIIAVNMCPSDGYEVEMRVNQHDAAVAAQTPGILVADELTMKPDPRTLSTSLVRVDGDVATLTSEGDVRVSTSQQALDKGFEDTAPPEGVSQLKLSGQMIEIVNPGTSCVHSEDTNDVNRGEESARPLQMSLFGVGHAKDEMQVCDNAVNAESNVGPSAREVADNLNKEANSITSDLSFMEKKDTVSGLCIGMRNDTPPVDLPLCDHITEAHDPSGNIPKMAKEYEDSIIRESQLIEATRKRAGDLPTCNLLDKRRRSHWDFILEEMAWMANDFMQERLWKISASAQLSRVVASHTREKHGQLATEKMQKNVARALSYAVIHFWQSVEIFCDKGPALLQKDKADVVKQHNVDGNEKYQEEDDSGKEKVNSEDSWFPVHDYALRFLKYSGRTISPHPYAEAPGTPDGLEGMCISDLSDDQLSEECLFYCVPPDAMQIYRESVESQFYCKHTGNVVQKEECETSMCDSVADGQRESIYEDDEVGTSNYSLPTSDGGFFLKLAHSKKNQMQQKYNGARISEVFGEMAYDQCYESKPGNHQFLQNGKRGSSFLVTIPTKRVRTAARQRFVSSSNQGSTGCQPLTSKTDVSSGDTNSCQDDQSSLYGGSVSRRNMEVESTLDFNKQLHFDGGDITNKSKKKKKAKYLGYNSSSNFPDSPFLVSGKGPVFEQRRPVDAMVQYEQKEFLKKRLDGQQFDSNGYNVLYGQHPSKKLKLSKLANDMPQDAPAILSGQTVSPAASQMSNMAFSHSKVIKIPTNTKGVKKFKASKMTAGNSNSGTPWSNFEDQALVVLVHDMGPNWELVSDAINSTLRFKCIYKKPMECKERHKLLMDKSVGDGGDSPEDSGSSQPYPSTLPGIPKGSAIQLFQRLQGPVEEDTLKSHFEKIISIGRQLHLSHRQISSQELKPVHSSHVVAISQACANQHGAMTPLELCDATSPNPDMSHGFPHPNGPNHPGSGSPTPSTTNNGVRSASSLLGMSTSASASSLNAAARDVQRFGHPRAASLQGDEQQRMQYSQMLNGRNLQQSGGTVSGPLPPGVDRGVRMLSAGPSMGLTPGLNRGMPMVRPPVQRMNSPGMLNMPANMLPSGGQGIQSGVSVHPGSISGSGNPMLRPRDPLQMMRPGQNLEDPRTMMMQEIQMQVSQGNSQSVHFNGFNGPYPNTSAGSLVQSFAVPQSQQPHQVPQQSHVFGTPHPSHLQGQGHLSPQQQAYAIRLAKEKQMHQQRVISQQHHQLPTATSVSVPQSGSPAQQQIHTTALNPSQQLKHPHAVQSDVSVTGTANQPGNATQQKQKQRQQAQQQPRQNQQRQQGQQQTKAPKNLVRSNMMMQQNHLVDASQATDFMPGSQTQALDKNVMQPSQCYYSSNASLLPSLPQSGNQSKAYQPLLTQSSGQLPMPLHSDISRQGSVPVTQTQGLLTAQQSPATPLSLPMQAQQHQHHIIPSHNNVQRVMLQQNRVIASDARIESLAESTQQNQMIATAPFSQLLDSSTAGVISANQQKQELLYDSRGVSQAAQLASSPQEAVPGNDTLVASSGQGLAQKQIPGNLAVHGQSIGNQWSQQQSRLQLQSQQQHPQTRNQQRSLVHGNVHTHLSDSGPG